MRLVWCFFFFHLCRVTELKNHSNHFFLCFNQDSYGMAVVPFCRCRFIQALQSTIVSLVQSPRFLDRDPHPIELIENNPKCPNSSFQNGRESAIEAITVRFQESTGFRSFLPAAPGEINVRPPGEPIFLIPDTLAMPQ